MGAAETDAQVQLVGEQPGFDLVLGGLLDVQGDAGMTGVDLLGTRRRERPLHRPRGDSRAVITLDGKYLPTKPF